MNTYIVDKPFEGCVVLEYDHKEFMAEVREESKVKLIPEMNPFYRKTHSEEVKKKLRGPRGNPNGLTGKRGKDTKKRKPGSGKHGTLKGTKWWNNGTDCTRSHNCPGKGWILGRIKKGGIKPPLN